MTFPFDPSWLLAFAALVRATAWLFVAPPFNTRMIPATVKVGIAAALALAGDPARAHGGIWRTCRHRSSSVALVTQAIVGFALGLLTVLLDQRDASRGSLVDLFAGF